MLNKREMAMAQELAREMLIAERKKSDKVFVKLWEDRIGKNIPIPLYLGIEVEH